MLTDQVWCSLQVNEKLLAGCVLIVLVILTVLTTNQCVKKSTILKIIEKLVLKWVSK